MDRLTHNGKTLVRNILKLADREYIKFVLLKYNLVNCKRRIDIDFFG